MFKCVWGGPLYPWKRPRCMPPSMETKGLLKLKAHSHMVKSCQIYYCKGNLTGFWATAQFWSIEKRIATIFHQLLIRIPVIFWIDSTNLKKTKLIDDETHHLSRNKPSFQAHKKTGPCHKKAPQRVAFTCLGLRSFRCRNLLRPKVKAQWCGLEIEGYPPPCKVGPYHPVISREL